MPHTTSSIMEGLSLGIDSKRSIPLDIIMNNAPTSRHVIRKPLKRVGNELSSNRRDDRGGQNEANEGSEGYKVTSKGKITVLSPLISTYDNESLLNTSYIADGRRKAALRIRAKIEEDERLGIRKKKRNKNQVRTTAGAKRQQKHYTAFPHS